MNADEKECFAGKSMTVKPEDVARLVRSSKATSTTGDFIHPSPSVARTTTFYAKPDDLQGLLEKYMDS